MQTLKRGTEITNEVLFDVITENNSLQERFNNLENYYFGKHEILKRERKEADINNRLVVNHAKYITDINVGYLLGSPVGYKTDNDKMKLDPVLDAYKKQTIADLDAELAKDLSIFGVQYEYVYANEDNEVKSANVDNRRTVIVYDTTLDHKKLFAIMYKPVYEKNKVTSYDIVYVDAEGVIEYNLKVNKDKVGALTETVAKKPHGFGEVPMIEYRNNSDYMGDFEQVLTLIDAYNVLQSDRVNDKEQLVDAILTIYGATTKDVDMELLRENRIISGIPADAKVEYLVKQMNEADADTLRQTIEADIHKISMTPNLSDKEFVGNSSGVAIRYKLLAFEQNIKTKERNFERGLMTRFRLYWNYLKSISKATGDMFIEDVDAVFTRNLPQNDVETSQIINNLDGKVSTETLIAQLSFIEDAETEYNKAREEAQARQAEVAKAFTSSEIKDGNNTNQNGDNSNSNDPANKDNQNSDNTK